MIWLATRLTFHNRARLLVTLFGVVFSAYLTLAETALYIGMMENATSIIRHSGADLWVASKGVQNFDFAKPFPDDRLKTLKGRQELLWAKPISLSWGFLKLPDGAQELVEIIGYDPAAPVGGGLGNGERRARRRGRRRQNDCRRERRATLRGASSRQPVGAQRSIHQARRSLAFCQDFYYRADRLHNL
jgi:hypothetical protein